MNRSIQITGKLWLGFSIRLVQHTSNSTSFFSLHLWTHSRDSHTPPSTTYCQTEANATRAEQVQEEPLPDDPHHWHN